jgi:hypothetical protein
MRVVILVGVFLVASCTGGAATDVPDPDTAPDSVEVRSPWPSALDVLIVIDARSSMWQVQNALVRAAPAFFARLAAAGLDVHVAVTTASTRSGVTVDASAGAFVHQAAAAHAPSCSVSVPRVCRADTACADLAQAHPGAWSCTGAGSVQVATVAENGTAATACVLGCASDADCEAAFGDGFGCVTPADGLPAGCVEPPPVDGCPVDLPPVLDAAHLDLVRCLAAVGTEGTTATAEGAGLEAGLLALARPADPCQATTVNWCQLTSAAEIEAKREWADRERSKVSAARSATTDPSLRAKLAAYSQFLMHCEATLASCQGSEDPDQPDLLRPDAPLLVVFVSNDDDCTREGDGFIDEAVACRSFLAPVTDLVDAYRALKPDAADVYVAGLVGVPSIGGSDSPWQPDDCTRVHPTEACACPADVPGADCGADLAGRLACLDACLGNAELEPGHKCSKLVPEACGCYEHDASGTAVNAGTGACVAVLADEPAYRTACQLACYEAATRIAAVQPGTRPYLCAGPYGRADGAPRYLELLEAFGDHGFALSVCAPDGVAGRLDDLATRLLGVLGLPPG